MPLPDSASVSTDDLSQYPKVPTYYLISRTISSETEEKIHDLVQLTPIYFGIITRMEDEPLAHKFATVVLKTKDEPTARLLAQELHDQAHGHENRSAIFIESTPSGSSLIAVYPDKEVSITC